MYTKLGPGLLESVYEGILFCKLTKRGLIVESQKPFSVVCDKVKLGIGFRTS
ncbi:GxxExxY protein [Flavobacterium urumqiense]|uniref:GxxExxY protein n=1 Tax=Flavobacterium urumqiense TaxID=935224 RepID=UPI001FCA3F37|nr:GxxExxY protein [Flavobacterium urumqiense]